MSLLERWGMTSPAPTSAGSALTRERKSRPSLLIVDDSTEIRTLLRAMLENAPYEVEEAHDGAVAVAKAKLRRYDLILMDIVMPEMDGVTAIRAIRQWEASRGQQRARIIVLTAWTTKQAERESRGSGADAYMSKPIRRAKLLEVLETRCSRIGDRPVIQT